MAAASIEFDTRLIRSSATGSTRGNFARVSPTISFYYALSDNIRTLSTNAASVGPPPEGLLYVPRLEQNDPCIDASSPYVPQNVTRRDDLPNVGFLPIAIAPWLSPQCVQNYLAAGRRDGIRSFIFFLPNRGNEPPPTPNDSAWGLSDGGRWKGDNQYPVYAVTSNVGQLVMEESALYSGPNLTTAPFADQLVGNFNGDDFAKIYVDINIAASATLPSLWIFLVVILAILVSIVGMVSVVMHFLQRRRRRQLQERVANGEVDLEFIGVKRLLVPQDVLDKMPIHRYEKDDTAVSIGPDQERNSPPSTPLPTVGGSSDDVRKQSGQHRKMASLSTNHFDQPSCAICLDDFIHNETMVRQLPCGHIFHPECVDIFLTQNSSLCPLCKSSTLPPGYCPPLTNAIVRRERLLRRAREHAERLGTSEGEAHRVINEHAMQRFRRRRENADLEMGVRPPQQAAPVVNNPSTRTATENVPAHGQDRRERARRRISAMLGPNAAPLDPDAEVARMPAWKRGFRRIFPAR